MPSAPCSLPDNVDDLRAFAADLHVRYQLLRDEVYAKTLHIEHLKAQLAAMRRARFGRSSEKLDRDIEQLELAIGELEEGKSQQDARRENQPLAQAWPQPAKAVPVRKPLPDHLPVDRIEHPAACVCQNCGGNRLTCIGTDERDVLEYVPSHFKIVRHARPKMSCRDCETIMQPPLPSLPIERGVPGPGLLAHVAVSKYCDQVRSKEPELLLGLIQVDEIASVPLRLQNIKLRDFCYVLPMAKNQQL